MTVKIYLRAIVKDKKNCLALFDSNRNGDIDNLVTDVNIGDTIVWESDCCSGIKSITRIYSKEDKHPIFKKEPKKRVLCKGFELQVPDDAEKDVPEKYTIECILEDNSELIIDPYVRVPPIRL
jgi:hypothetical protein